MSFSTWLCLRCIILHDSTMNKGEDLRALLLALSRIVCSFISMTSVGSHYRVDLEEEVAQHVSFDFGVAELDAQENGLETSDTSLVV